MVSVEAVLEADVGSFNPRVRVNDVAIEEEKAAASGQAQPSPSESSSYR